MLLTYKIYLCVCIFLLWLDPGSSKIVESCSDGCPVYQLNGVFAPLENSDYAISVRQEGALQISINDTSLTGHQEGIWYNITMTRKDDQYCVSAPGLLPKTFNTTSRSLTLWTKVGQKSLWKLNCGSALCGCRRLRFLAVSLDLEALPDTLYWWPDQEGLRFTENNNHKSEIVSFSDTQKWHDVTVDKSPEGTSATMRSSSLNFSFENISMTKGLWIAGVNYEGTVQSNYFALGCKESPRGAPHDTSFWHPKVKDVGSQNVLRKTGAQNDIYFYVVVIAIPILLIIITALVVFIIMKMRSLMRRGIQLPNSRPNETGIPLPDDTRFEAEENEPATRGIVQYTESETEDHVYCEIDSGGLHAQLAREQKEPATRDMAQY